MMDLINQLEERVDGMSTASQEVNLTKGQIEAIIIDNNRLREECRVIAEQAIEYKYEAEEKVNRHAEAWKESLHTQISDWERFTGKKFFDEKTDENVDFERMVCDVDDDISDWKWESTIDCTLDVYSDSDSAEIKIEKSVDSDEKIDMIDKIAKAVIEKFLSGEYYRYSEEEKNNG
jgi:hypothetical protein